MAAQDKNHRHWHRLVVVGAAALVAVGVWQGVASAMGSSTFAGAPVEEFNSNCGETEGSPIIGQADFKRTGNTMRVDFALDGGNGAAKFRLELWDGTTCEKIAGLGTFKTNNSGVGKGRGETGVKGHDQFFATAYDKTHGGYNDSLIVTLP